MQLEREDELEATIEECLSELEEVEAALIREYHIQRPRTTLPNFAARWGLSSKQMAELKVRALVQLKERLAERNIFSLGDIL